MLTLWAQANVESSPIFSPYFLGCAHRYALRGLHAVNNLTLTQTPDRWMAFYEANPGGGTLNAESPPSFLDAALMSAPFVVAGLALIIGGGVYAGWGGVKRGRGMQRFGLQAFVLGGSCCSSLVSS